MPLLIDSNWTELEDLAGYSAYVVRLQPDVQGITLEKQYAYVWPSIYAYFASRDLGPLELDLVLPPYSPLISEPILVWLYHKEGREEYGKGVVTDEYRGTHEIYLWNMWAEIMSWLEIQLELQDNKYLHVMQYIAPVLYRYLSLPRLLPVFLL